MSGWQVVWQLAEPLREACQESQEGRRGGCQSTLTCECFDASLYAFYLLEFCCDGSQDSCGLVGETDGVCFEVHVS